MTRIIELIYTEERRGAGVDEDPYRIVPQLYTKDGQLVAEDDLWIRAAHTESAFQKASFFHSAPLRVNP